VKTIGNLFWVTIDYCRFDGVRESWWKFLIWFLFQFIVIWAIAVPYIILNSSQANVPLQANDYVGWVMFAIGFICESVADHQKFTYRRNSKNGNHWCDKGIWKFSRHPNYFGEIAVWWGIWISCASVFQTFEFFSVLSPILITIILMCGSGVPTTEKSADKRFGTSIEYQEYKRRTPVCVPFIPGVFGGVAKVIFCCEWPLYQYAKTSNTDSV
jgi:steroid 5-alpha reductase family enzyme